MSRIKCDECGQFFTPVDWEYSEDRKAYEQRMIKANNDKCFDGAFKKCTKSS